MRAVVEIKNGVHWVGAVDWDIKDFHGYSTYKGTTYNSYLILDDKITLFDTVKKPFKNDLLHNIYKVIDPSKIDYLVINHVEPDHSGSIPEMVEIIKPQKIFCSARNYYSRSVQAEPNSYTNSLPSSRFVYCWRLQNLRCGC